MGNLLIHSMAEFGEPLIESLEKNRLACYLAVIGWQDRHHAA